MNKELTAQLNEKYPEMFMFHNFRSSNCFEFECGDGWYNLLNVLLGEITIYVKGTIERVEKFEDAREKIDAGLAGTVPKYIVDYIELIDAGKATWPEKVDYPEARQIKEKFATMRVYMHGCDNVIAELCNFAETMTITTCEECGNIGSLRNGTWMKTLCDEHEANRQKKLADQDKLYKAQRAGKMILGR